MNDYTLNVYDEDDNVVKTVTAQFVDLKYGPIRVQSTDRKSVV